MIIGNRYYWDDIESGWYEVTETVHDRLMAIREQINQRMLDYMIANGTPMPKPILISTMADDGDEGMSCRDLWMNSEPGTKLESYFTPAIQPLIDEYGNSDTSNDGSNNDTRKD